MFELNYTSLHIFYRLPYVRLAALPLSVAAVERYGEDILTDSRFDELWPKLKAKRNAELLPYIRARRAVLAAGGVSGLGLLAFQL